MNYKTVSNPSHHYEIRVSGHLADPRSTNFPGLQVIPQPNGETLIRGPLVDQAALFGVLIRIRDLGIPLISVNYIS